MERSKDDDSGYFSRGSDGYNTPTNSQWLQDTLSDLDNQMKAIMNIIQEEGDTFAKKAKIFFQRKPELIKLINELHKSHASLAEKHERLRSECNRALHLRLFNSSSPFAQRRTLRFRIRSFDDESDFGLGMEHEVVSRGIKGDANEEVDDSQVDSMEREETLEELRLKVAKLVEENMNEQKELIKRNEEKNEIIKQQYFEINMLEDENRNLRSLVANDNNEEENGVELKHQKKFKLSKFKRFCCIGKSDD